MLYASNIFVSQIFLSLLDPLRPRNTARHLNHLAKTAKHLKKCGRELKTNVTTTTSEQVLSSSLRIEEPAKIHSPMSKDVRGAAQKGFRHRRDNGPDHVDVRIASESLVWTRKTDEKMRKESKKRNVGFEPKQGLSDLNKTMIEHLHSRREKLLGRRPPKVL
jgi:hypothetical protein